MFALDLPSRVFVEEGARIEAAFAAACEWLKSLGVFQASNRFTEYLKLLNDFRRGHDGLMNAPDGLERYINALAEASELIRIRKSLQEIDASEY